MSTFAGQASGATAVNLSRLPFPGVVEALSFEGIVADSKVQLVDLIRLDDPTAALAMEEALKLPSEPLVKLIEVFAYREVMLRQRVNDSAKAVMIAYAIGADLDNLVALLGVERIELVPADPVTNAPAIMENDEALRRRALLAPEAYSVAGPEGAYISHALSASGDVLDASATSPSPGVVLVTILARNVTGVPDQALLDLVDAAVSAETVRPLTDQVVVAPAEIIDYVIAAKVKTFAGPDGAIVMTEARARLDRYVAECFRLGRDPTRSGIITALSAEGVQDVQLTAPAANVVVTRLQAARCTGITIQHAGLGE